MVYFFGIVIDIVINSRYVVKGIEYKIKMVVKKSIINMIFCFFWLFVGWNFWKSFDFWFCSNDCIMVILVVIIKISGIRKVVDRVIRKIIVILVFWM